jgi:hypothetical protein
LRTVTRVVDWASPTSVRALTSSVGEGISCNAEKSAYADCGVCCQNVFSQSTTSGDVDNQYTLRAVASLL